MNRTPRKPLLFDSGRAASGPQMRTNPLHHSLEDDLVGKDQYWETECALDLERDVEAAEGLGVVDLANSGVTSNLGASSSHRIEGCSRNHHSNHAHDSSSRCRGGYDCSGCGGCICSRCAVLCPRCDQLKCQSCMTVAPVSSCCCGAVNQANSSSVFRFAAPGAAAKIAALIENPPQRTPLAHVSRGESVAAKCPLRPESCCHQCARNLFRREFCKGKL